MFFGFGFDIHFILERARLYIEGGRRAENIVRMNEIVKERTEGWGATSKFAIFVHTRTRNIMNTFMCVHLCAKLKFTFMMSVLLNIGAVNFQPWDLPLNIHEEIGYFVEQLFNIYALYGNIKKR